MLSSKHKKNIIEFLKENLPATIVCLTIFVWVAAVILFNTPKERSIEYLVIFFYILSIILLPIQIFFWKESKALGAKKVLFLIFLFASSISILIDHFTIGGGTEKGLLTAALTGLITLLFVFGVSIQILIWIYLCVKKSIVNSKKRDI